MMETIDQEECATLSYWINETDSLEKQGNRLTRRPCKGDKFEIEMFEAKSVCGTCQNMFATWTFISIGRRVTQVSKFASRLRGESILFSEGPKKH